MPGRGAPTPRRYAQAIFQIAIEQSQADRWRQDLRVMVEATWSESTKVMLEAPGVQPSDRQTAIRRALPDVSPLAANLLALLAQRGTVSMLPRILESFETMLDEHQGMIHATATTAVPLEPADQQRVAERLKALFGKQVILETHVDSGILGGMIVRTGDQVIDGSTRGKLELLRKTLRERAAL